MPAFSGSLRNVNIDSGDHSTAVAPIFLPRATSFAISVTRPRDAVPLWADNTPEPVAPISSVTTTLVPRDWSALRSDNPHPWRSLRRRQHRMHPRPGRCLDRPDSLHKALVAIVSMSPALPPAPPPIPVPSPVPPAPKTINLGDMGLAFHILESDIPENTIPSPATPINSEFGPITSPLALGCALGIARRPLLAIDDVYASIWGHEGKGWHTEAAWNLPTDFRIFITTISQVVRTHHEFAVFFEAPLIAFLEAWTEHFLGLG